eukprot:TRINITY_DN786_c0_g1_i1.p1 TRINITY_DN786_c0_g1~~TRINITY_DN786_c0_g1_i1.p1  ORF type:complete len:106 (-),score=1.76 TRINITY_DN786_c0_g1_i1:281-598(-)
MKEDESLRLPFPHTRHCGSPVLVEAIRHHLRCLIPESAQPPPGQLGCGVGTVAVQSEGLLVLHESMHRAWGYVTPVPYHLVQNRRCGLSFHGDLVHEARHERIRG